MEVGLGSRNPVKVSATETALPDASVDPLSIDSGVSEQPTGRVETVRGAVTRAERAFAAGDYGLGVGIEGGVARRDGVDGLWLVMWAAATDGEHVGRGAGPSLRLPNDIAERVTSGEELGPVMDDVLGTNDVAERYGAAGALSGHVIDRESALVHALGGALGPFRTDHYEAEPDRP